MTNGRNVTHIDQLKLLLEKAGLIRWKHSDVLRDPRFQFNVFSLLREPHDEVYLHSRFLAELLDPKGAHCRQDAFLRVFLQHLGIEDFPIQDARVAREYHNIDIFISGDDHAIIIENKVLAGDQHRQLERCFRVASGLGFSDITIVYLTLHGDNPSKQSLGTLAHEADKIVNCLSYEDDIRAWLHACVERAVRHPVVRETIVQYQRLIETLTGHSLSREYTMELKDLLVDEKNIALATDICQALVKAKIDVQFAFWNELEARLRQEGLEVSDGGATYPKYSLKRVQGFHERGRRKRYGIALHLDDLTEDIELLFFIQVRGGPYYSFIVVRDDDRKIAREAQFDRLAEICTQVDESFKRSDLSLGWKNPSRGVSFKNFNNADAFALADPAKRQRYIEDLVTEIKALIGDFMVRFRSEPVGQDGRPVD